MSCRAWICPGAIALMLFSSLADAQTFDPSMTPTERYNESNAIGVGALDEINFYCVWPEWHVRPPMLTAVELATGKLRWSSSGRFVLPNTFRAEGGWVIFANSERPQMNFNGTGWIEAFHIINSETGAEIAIPHDESRNTFVDRPRVQQGRCLTLQGQVVQCDDGSVIGDLGPGEHQTLLADGRLYVATLQVNESDQYDRRRFFRRFEFKSMRLEREMELPLEVTWIPVAARDEIVIAKSEVAERQYQLVRLDLQHKDIRWRVKFPRSVLASQAIWDGDTKVTLAMGGASVIRPITVDIATGAIAPDPNWQDPHAVLAWHGEPTRFPDLVACNATRILGRWRFQQIICVDSTTGQLMWEQSAGDHLISRLFCHPQGMGNYVVAETDDGFDIITVETGERKRLTPRDLGLQSIRASQPVDKDERPTNEVADYLFRSRSNDWIWDRALLLAPLLPLAVWLPWALFRRRYPYSEPPKRVLKWK